MFKSKLWRNKYFHYFLIFSLLLHAILYFFFFNVSFRKHSITMIRGLLDSLALSPAERLKRVQQHQMLIKKLQELRQPRDSGLPAKLKPRKSDFGWVFFNDEPSAAPAGPVQVPTTEEGEVAQAPTPHATELVPEKPKIPAEQPVAAVAAVQPPTIKQLPVQPVKPKLPTATKEQQLVPLVQATAAAEEHREKAAPAVHRSLAKIKSAAVQPTQRLEKQVKKVAKRAQAPRELTIESLVDELDTGADVEHPEALQPLEEYLEEPVYHDTRAAQPSAFAQGATADKSADVQARIARIVRMQEQLSHFAPAVKGAAAAAADGGAATSGTGKVATAKVRGARAMRHRDGRSIIALTKGFVENLKDEGEDDIECEGDPNKRPSFEEMKYISYESNINWCLQAAWKQNFAYNHTVHAREGKAVIEFTLNEKGYVTHSELLQSTGYRELDAVIMKNLQFASPFPPLPKHFGVKNYTTGRIVHVFCNKFGM